MSSNSDGIKRRGTSQKYATTIAGTDSQNVLEIETAVIEKAISWRSIFNFTTNQDLFVKISACILTIIAGGLKPTLAIFLGEVFDQMVAFGSGTTTGTQLVHSVSKWCIVLTVLGVFKWLMNGGFFALWMLFGELQAKNVRNMMFAGMLEKEIEWYDTRSDGISSLLVRVQTQVRELQMATSQPLGFFIEDAASALVALGISLYYSWKLTFVILASLPILALGTHLAGRKFEAAVESQKKNLTIASRHAYTSFANIAVVKAYNAQDEEAWHFQQAIKKAAKFYLVQAHATAIMMGFTRFMTVVMFVQGFWYGLVLVRQGISAGAVLTTFYSVLLGVQSAESLIPQWMVLAKGMSAGETLRHIMLQIERGREVTKMSGFIKPKECFGDIEVSDVSFSYPLEPDRPALRNTSFFFPGGETTFVIGRNGSGKSTLCDLLMRFYQPSKGDILIDNQAIQTLDLKWLRSNITFVQQESILFNETLYQNIALGRLNYPTVSTDAIELACQTALLQPTINDLPDGLDTFIGSSGSNLSGGQKQRVSIARARLRDSPILILDEALSALDPVSRTMVMGAIRAWRKGKTTIIITHQIDQVLDEDFVYLLDKGKIVQQGYRRKLEEDESGPFASFVYQNSARDSRHPEFPAISDSPHGRRISLDSGYTSDAESSRDEHAKTRRAPIGLRRLSNFLGVNTGTQESHVEDKSDYRIVPHGLRRLSNFLGVNDASHAQQYTASRRMSRGMPTMRTNDIITEGIWTSPNPFSTSLPTPLELKKPLPSMPKALSKRDAYTPRSVREQRSLQGLKLPQKILDRGTETSKGAPVRLVRHEIELIQLMGDTTTESRPTTGKLDRPRHDGFKDAKTDTWARLMALEGNPFVQKRRKSSSHYKHEASISRILGTVWPLLLWHDRVALVLGFFAAFINAASTPAFSYVLARLLNTYYTPSDQSIEARKWAFAILGIALADGLSSFYFHWCLEYCGQIWIDTLRVQAMKRILAQPKSWFDKTRNSPGALSESLDRNAEEMRNILGRFAGYVFVAGSMMSIAVVWAFVVCWKLTLVGLASSPVIFICSRLFETMTAKWEHKSNIAAEVTAGIFRETFSSIRVVRALTLEDYFKDKHTKAVDEAYAVGKRRAVSSGFFFGLSDSTDSFLTALVLYYGAVILSSQSWSVASILQVITLLLFSSGNAAAVIAFIPQFSTSKATATRILRLAHLPSSAPSENTGIQHLANPFPIQLTDLSFSYPTRPNAIVLHNTTIRFNAGTFTAIVGPSGSGKSTIASLLLGLYPPSPSSLSPFAPPTPPLTFGHIPIENIHPTSLRTTIALVSQTPTLFPGTVAENIIYGLSESSPFRAQSHIERAARDASIHDFITSLPIGYGTRIGEGGQGVSGGQAQRIALARALVRRPTVLVLDEVTSALDVESARSVRESVQRLVSGGEDREGCERGVDGLRRRMAVVCITHSVEMMRVAQRIVVLEQGTVVQEGTYEDLIRRAGPFRRLVGAD